MTTSIICRICGREIGPHHALIAEHARCQPPTDPDELRAMEARFQARYAWGLHALSRLVHEQRRTGKKG